MQLADTAHDDVHIAVATFDLSVAPDADSSLVNPPLARSS